MTIPSPHSWHPSLVKILNVYFKLYFNFQPDLKSSAAEFCLFPPCFSSAHFCEECPAHMLAAALGNICCSCPSLQRNLALLQCFNKTKIVFFLPQIIRVSSNIYWKFTEHDIQNIFISTPPSTPGVLHMIFKVPIQSYQLETSLSTPRFLDTVQISSFFLLFFIELVDFLLLL